MGNLRTLSSRRLPIQTNAGYTLHRKEGSMRVTRRKIEASPLI
jgi:hypothetical protein